MELVQIFTSACETAFSHVVKTIILIASLFQENNYMQACFVFFSAINVTSTAYCFLLLHYCKTWFSPQLIIATQEVI